MSSILIVEDDTDLVETYTDLLRSRGYTTNSAARAVEAIELVVNTEPSIIILDLSLPGNSGISVLDFIRRQERLKHVKILVVTGHSEMTDPGLVDHADIILIKPVTNEQLLTMIERFLPAARATSPPSQDV